MSKSRAPGQGSNSGSSHADVSSSKVPNVSQSASSSKKSNSSSQPWTIGQGVPGFCTSFDASGKGGGAFRSISENFTVNPANGSLSLSIPIDLSPTRGGFAPELRLEYQSGAGNGPFGFGWNMNIQSFGRNTARGVPTYTDNDHHMTFSGADIIRAVCKDGSLKPIRLSQGFSITEFRQRIDAESTRLERWTSVADASDVHWRATSSSNVVSIYGDTDDSRVFDSAPHSNRVFQWLLSRSYDANGNAIEYNYKAENDDGVMDSHNWLPPHELSRSALARTRARYLKSVRYGNRTPARDLVTWEAARWPTEFMFEALLDYGEHTDDMQPLTIGKPWDLRQDPFSRCNAGFELRLYRLCRRVLMIHHFPEHTGVVDSLVRSTSFEYNEQPQRSVLERLTIRGHGPEGDTAICPPWTFEYTNVPPAPSVQTMSTNISTLPTVPGLEGGFSSEWLDLDGDGVPGLLTKLPGGALAYQRHSPTSRFQASDKGALYQRLKLLKGCPSSTYGGVEDIEANGKLHFICEDEQGARVGHHPRLSNDWWGTFQPFPNCSFATTQSQRETISLDLTGNGTPDRIVMLEESGDLVWQQNLGLAGMSGYKRTKWQDNHHPLESKKTKIAAVDMTGDGMSDLVEISHAGVTYWANEGHGSFGHAICMANPPLLSSWTDFDPIRVRLVDVDGSGTCDLLYLLPSGGAMLYFNLAGNSWSDGSFIPHIPPATLQMPVFTLDILGQGSACLCWADVSQSPGQITVKYLDLMGGKKPHLLKTYRNGLGCVTYIMYEPSTRFSQQDELDNLAWTTKLPFPVQCASRIETHDLITGNKKTCNYTYHNGSYDHGEREFAGFEMVESRSSEFIPLGSGDTYQSLPVLTRTWYNTGLGPEVDPRRFFSSAELSSKLEAVDVHAATPWRALRGLRVRSEVFEKENEPPLVMEEFSYDVVELQPTSTNLFASWRATPRADLKTQHDRSMADPRRTHKIILSTNTFGDIEDEMTVVYPRNIKFTAKPAHESVALNQRAGNITLVQTRYTNAVDEWPHYHKPLPCKTKNCEIIGFPLHSLLDVESTRKISFSESDTISIKLRDEQRMVYRDQHLRKPLDAGALDPCSTLEQTYELAYAKSLVDKIQQGRDRCGATFSMDKYLLRAKYVQVKGDDDQSWWQPSPVPRFRIWDGDESELRIARATFYVPNVLQDVFGNATMLQFDPDSLLAQRQVDAVGNEIQFENDYHFLQPISLIDANQNATECKLDPLGRTIAKAVTGKADGTSLYRDSLDSFQSEITQGDMEAILDDPAGDVAWKVLGRANTRTIYSSDVYPSDGVSISGEATLPFCTVELSRDLSFEYGSESMIHVVVTHLDGLGQPIQISTLADPQGEDRKWHIENLPTKDWQGQTLRTHVPVFAPSPRFVRPGDNATAAETTLYDALGRLVGSLRPDFTWTKTIIQPWTTISYSVQDTLSYDDPRLDHDVGCYFGTLTMREPFVPWTRDHEAAVNAVGIEPAKYGSAPTIIHLGSCGLPLEQRRDLPGMVEETKKPTTHKTRMRYDCSGNLIALYDSLERCVEKCLYDTIGRKLWTSSMDAGEEWSLFNASGDEHVSWNSRGIEYQHTYDQLHRETGKWLHTGLNTRELVVETIYGEAHEAATLENLRARPWMVRDQSGVHMNEQYDLRGNCSRKSFQPAIEYKSTVDWSKDVPLEDMRFSQTTTFNLFAKIIHEEDDSLNTTRRRYNRLGLEIATDYHDSNDSEWQSILAAASYTADGLPERIERGNQTMTLYEYHPETRLQTRQTTIRSTDRRQTVLEDLRTIYDCNGRKIHVIDSAKETVTFRNCTVAPVWCYTYDSLGQLLSATGRGLLSDAAGKGNHLEPHGVASGVSQKAGRNALKSYQYLETYSYDLEGNILSVKHEALRDSSISGWTRMYTYGEPSMLEDGVFNNRLSKTVVGDKEERYEYNSTGCITGLASYSRLEWNNDNLLAASARQIVKDGVPESTYYVYDHAGNRVRKVTEAVSSSLTGPARKRLDTFFIFSQQVQRKVVEKVVQTATKFSIVGAPAENRGPEKLAVSEKTEHVSLMRYLVGDSMETDAEGDLISYEEYSPFGAIMYNAVRHDIEAPSAYRFLRYEFDGESGLYHCGARYYCPWLGRWTSPDPIGTKDGTNRYCYVGNDPINGRDDSGLSQQPKDFLGFMKQNFFTNRPAYQLDNMGRLTYHGPSSSQKEAAQRAALKTMGELNAMSRKNDINSTENGSKTTQSLYSIKKAQFEGRVAAKILSHTKGGFLMNLAVTAAVELGSSKVETGFKSVVPKSFAPEGTTTKAADMANGVKDMASSKSGFVWGATKMLWENRSSQKTEKVDKGTSEQSSPPGAEKDSDQQQTDAPDPKEQFLF